MRASAAGADRVSPAYSGGAGTKGGLQASEQLLKLQYHLSELERIAIVSALGLNTTAVLPYCCCIIILASLTIKNWPPKYEAHSALSCKVSLSASGPPSGLSF
ncbi:hypothetical protein RJ641_017777 [Dillenia turbinata]|uniref:Uncharacterized protein n=1 Tax=Dillenia turbinata TaxID=194707 RepID=A0AAN8YXR9_9MAGN